MFRLKGEKKKKRLRKLRLQNFARFHRWSRLLEAKQNIPLQNTNERMQALTHIQPLKCFFILTREIY